MSPSIRRSPLWAVCLLALVLGGVTASPTSDARAAPPAITAPEHQNRLIDAEIARMAPRTPGITNVFFVGFAGYGEQRVFRKEAELARKVFGSRFGSQRRSIELVNDIHDRSTYPLATFDNLRYAVAQVGRRMDPNEDVLVLMLTSHGSRRAGIALTNGDLVDDDLSPKDVKQVLDEAGIRWRFIVASACYSGIFIRPLKNDSTAILTAADSRHTSFGCADDRDLTYFGEALLRDSLPKPCSLEDAFASTQTIIRKREADEGEIHSNPQIYIGSKMKTKLASLQPQPTQSCAADRGSARDRSATRGSDTRASQQVPSGAAGVHP